MDSLFDIIGNIMADGITEIFTDSDCRFVCSLLLFSICIIGEIILLNLNKRDIINTSKGIFLGFLIINITISLTSVMLCKFWFAIIISVITILILPIFEKKELNEYLNSEYKLSLNKYLIYLFTSIFSIFLGVIFIKILP